MDEQIGRYRLIKELGEGAMARVYLAELETGIGFKRKVALKVVRPEFAKDKKFVALMSREAMIGSMLQHPNIVQTLEFNEADGRSFLALEFVEGETLGELMDHNEDAEGRGLPLMLALEVMVQVLKGLSYAHNLQSHEGEVMGIVHRDLKPGNIMLSQHGLVKVMDFGIATAKIASANITTVGQVRGTPIYMAPEQVTGKPLDGRADQFAAGTVLYELLTGKQLFIDNNLIRIMQRVARAEVQEQLGELKELHPALAPILARMWARDPGDRFPDCEEAARQLEDIVFEMKAAARHAESHPGEVALPAHATETYDDEEQTDSHGFFAAVGGFVRRLFGGAPVVVSPPKKRKKKRRKTRAAAGRDLPSTTVAQPSLRPQDDSLGSMDVVFEDATSSNFDVPASAREPEPPAPAPPPVVEKSLDGTTSPKLKTILGPQTLPNPGPPVEPEPGSKKLDPFFYENFDE